MRILGKKLSGSDVKAFGKKLTNNAQIFGRKFTNTVDKIAPILTVAGELTGHPEVALASQGVQALTHGVDNAVRKAGGVANSLDNANKFREAGINFGESYNQVKQQANDLLTRS